MGDRATRAFVGLAVVAAHGVLGVLLREPPMAPRVSVSVVAYRPPGATSPALRARVPGAEDSGRRVAPGPRPARPGAGPLRARPGIIGAAPAAGPSGPPAGTVATAPAAGPPRPRPGIVAAAPAPGPSGPPAGTVAAARGVGPPRAHAGTIAAAPAVGPLQAHLGPVAAAPAAGPAWAASGSAAATPGTALAGSEAGGTSGVTPDPAGALRIDGEVLRRAARDAMRETPAGDAPRSRPGTLAGAMADARVPGCLDPDAMKLEPVRLTGLLGLPILAHAALSGRCR